MSAGAVFSLIANDGKADKIINATQLLNDRIASIMCMRAKNGYADATPTIIDIERTHILYVNAHFKPFAAIAYEYNKVKSQNGIPTFDNGVQFSIPQFGDFFADMVVAVTLASTQATLGVIPAFPAFIGPDNQVVTTTRKISGLENTVDNIYTQYTHEYIDIAGNVLTVGDPARNFVRYAEYVGERLFKKTSFTVNSNPLDDYDNNAVVFYRKFQIGPHKLTGWKRLMGQEVPVEGYSSLITIDSSSNYPDNVADLVDVNGDAVIGAPTTAATTARKLVHVVSGPQTPKLTQPELDLWVKLIFWFNLDPRLSIASVAIPYGQRYINLEFEQQAKLLFVAPGNLFLRLTVEQQFSQDATAGTAAALAVEDVQKWQTITPVLASGSTIDTTQTVKKCELYINNLFVTSEIHDIYIKRIGFSLIRLHRTQIDRINEANAQKLMQQFKWPIEKFYIGIKPVENVSASNPNQYRDWHRFTALTDNVLDLSSRAEVDVMIDNATAFNAVSNNHKTSSIQYSAESITYPVETETIETLRIEVHGITIYQSFKSAFYRDYLTSTFGGVNIITPEDKGALMVNFCLYPGTYQPSGHINVSRAREFYIEYTSNYVSTANPCDMIVVACAINFLLITDGSAVIRYTT